MGYQAYEEYEECHKFLAELANQAATKTQELKAVEEGLLLVVDKELQLDLEMQEVIALCSELEKIKLEHDRENQLLKEEVSKLAKDKKTLEERNKSL